MIGVLFFHAEVEEVVLDLQEMTEVQILMKMKELEVMDSLSHLLDLPIRLGREEVVELMCFQFMEKAGGRREEATH